MALSRKKGNCMKRQGQLLCKVAAGALVFAVMLLAPRARADQDTDKNLKHKDTTFLKEAAQGGMAEVQLGQLAQQKAQNDQIKQLGQKVQADHTKACGTRPTPYNAPRPTWRFDPNVPHEPHRRNISAHQT